MRVNTRLTRNTSVSPSPVAGLFFAPVILAGLAVFAVLAALAAVAWICGAAVWITGKGILWVIKHEKHHPAHR